MVLALTLLVSAPCLAQDVPLRPLTYSLDPKLSAGPIANFLELYVDPESFVRDLKAAKPPTAAAPAVETPAATAVNTPPTGLLLVLNDRGSWADVSVNGAKVGKIGPHIYGVIGPVPSGTYELSLSYANGYVWNGEAVTSNEDAPGAFGGAPSALARPDGSHTTKLRKK